MPIEDEFLERCRADRAEYARALADLESGRIKLRMGSVTSGEIVDITAEHAGHLRRIIVELDALLELES